MNDFALTSPKPIPRQKSKREREIIKHQRKQEKQRLKYEAEQLERQRNSKPATVLTVKHQPTYTCLSYKRADGSKETRKPPAAFISKNEVQSVKSQTRLKNAINWILLFADKKRVYSKKGWISKRTNKEQHNYYFRLAFITLTLSAPQVHNDDFIKKHLLQPFLYWLTRYRNCLYVWKAESQLNGNIHFHITIDTFVHWKSIRAKWNNLLAKYGYCKVMQDGSNDRGDAATQIKSVLNEKKCANDIASYMSKKDEVTKKDIKSILSDSPGFDTANVHCKWNSDAKEPDKKWYKRVIEGRLWGCSESLSNINIFINEHHTDFKKEEHIYFHENADIQNLGEIVIAKEKQRYSKYEEPVRVMRCITDDDIERRYRFMKNVFIHKHISLMKKGATLQKLIHEEKLSRKKNFQTFFTEN